MNILARILFSFLLIPLLVSCAYTPPSPTLTVILDSYSPLNSDNLKDSYPVLVTFYQLKEPSKFEQADYFSLLDKAEKVLSDALIQKHEVEVRPNEEMKREFLLSPDSKYLGVFAAFRDIEKSHWKEIINLNNESNGNYTFSLQNLTLKKIP